MSGFLYTVFASGENQPDPALLRVTFLDIFSWDSRAAARKWLEAIRDNSSNPSCQNAKGMSCSDGSDGETLKDCWLRALLQLMRNKLGFKKD